MSVQFIYESHKFILSKITKFRVTTLVMGRGVFSVSITYSLKRIIIQVSLYQLILFIFSLYYLSFIHIRFFLQVLRPSLIIIFKRKYGKENTELDILSWWKTNGFKYPTLKKVVRDILAIPISTVASESAFSTSGRLVSPHRSRLHKRRWRR